MSYLVETGEHQLWKRHVDQLKTLADAKPVDGRDVVSPDSTDTHEDFKVSIPSPADISPAIPASDGDPEEPSVPPPDSVSPPTDRYPRRHRVAPEYFGFRNGEN